MIDTTNRDDDEKNFSWTRLLRENLKSSGKVLLQNNEMALNNLSQKKVTAFINTFVLDQPKYVWMKTTVDGIVFCNKKSACTALEVLIATWNSHRWDIYRQVIDAPLRDHHCVVPSIDKPIFHYYMPVGEKCWKQTRA